MENATSFNEIFESMSVASPLEAVPDAMAIVNIDGEIVVVNAQAEEMFGYARPDLVGGAIELLIPERPRAPHHERRTAYAADPQLRAMGSRRPLYGLRKDGSELPIEISLSPLKTERGLFVGSAFTLPSPGVTHDGGAS